MRINKSSPELPAVERGKAITVYINDEPVEAFEGEMISSVLTAAGYRTFSHSQTSKRPKGLYCGMGICYECLVTINGTSTVRACQTPVEENMRIDTCSEVKL